MIYNYELPIELKNEWERVISQKVVKELVFSFMPGETSKSISCKLLQNTFISLVRRFLPSCLIIGFWLKGFLIQIALVQLGSLQNNRSDSDWQTIITASGFI
jgi:hypothetical protein